ncbi:MAG: DUF4870 domain-containing protein [Candidatus Omnitrophica bacterium]|nr:DUF4870 domain-containing protein [Candidatus Omnitrophota bacterium]
METKDLGKTSVGLQANVAALLSYLAGFITGIIFYVLEKENKFVRFHAMQSIIVFGFLWALNMVIGFMMPFLPLRAMILSLISIIAIILWIILMVKAYQGEYFKLPVAGDIAEKSA